jgi:hypothetical protein
MVNQWLLHLLPGLEYSQLCESKTDFLGLSLDIWSQNKPTTKIPAQTNFITKLTGLTQELTILLDIMSINLSHLAYTDILPR